MEEVSGSFVVIVMFTSEAPRLLSPSEAMEMTLPPMSSDDWRHADTALQSSFVCSACFSRLQVPEIRIGRLP